MVINGKRTPCLPQSTTAVWTHTAIPAIAATTRPATSTVLMIQRCESPTRDAEISPRTNESTA